MKRERGMALGWMYLIGAAAVLVALGGLYMLIEHRGYERGKAEVQKDWDDAVDKQAAAELEQGNAAAKTLEAGNAKAKVVYRIITQQVDKYIDRAVYRNVCLDADGLRDANAALIGAASPAPGKSDEPVRGSGAASGRDGGERAPEADRGGGALLRMPAKADGAR